MDRWVCGEGVASLAFLCHEYSSTAFEKSEARLR